MILVPDKDDALLKTYVSQLTRTEIFYSEDRKIKVMLSYITDNFKLLTIGNNPNIGIRPDDKTTDDILSQFIGSKYIATEIVGIMNPIAGVRRWIIYVRQDR